MAQKQEFSPGFIVIDDPSTRKPTNTKVEAPKEFPTLSQYPAQIGIGIGKGILSTAKNIESGSRKAGEKLAGTPSNKTEAGRALQGFLGSKPLIPEEHTQTENFPQDIGYAGEQMGEFVLGGGIVGRAMRGMGMIPQMLGQGATGAGIAAAHGATPEEAAGTGIVAAAMPPVFKGLGAISGAIGQRLKDSPFGRFFMRNMPEAPPPAAPAAPASTPIDAEFVVDDAVPYIVRSRTALPAGSPPPAAAPAPPPTQVSGRPVQGALSGAPGSTRPQLPPSDVVILPEGSGSPIQPDPRLPSVYARTQVTGPPSPPAVMTRGQGNVLGQEGGIPVRGEQTVTGIKTGAGPQKWEVAKKKGTAGRTATDPPKPPKKKGK